MLARFWGTRGSLPAPLGAAAVRAKVREALLAARGKGLETPAAVDAFIAEALPFTVSGTFGGNTSCVEIDRAGGELVLCDLGTGVREFGTRLLARDGAARKQRINVFMSHPHWDHIMGFPFLPHIYIPGNVIRIFGCHARLREAFERQHAAPCFPIDFHALPSTIEFVPLEPGRGYTIAGLEVEAITQRHGGDSYGYRFRHGGKSLVYSTDNEHRYESLDAHYPFVGFIRDADLLIFDAMYSLADQISVKEDWGHSSNMIGVELAQFAHVKHLVLFHHEPIYDDRAMATILAETRRYEELSRSGHKLVVSSAYDGLEIEL